MVGRPSRRSGSVWRTLTEVREWSGGPLKVWEWSGDPPKVLQVIGRPSQRSRSDREALQKVWEW